MHIHINRTVQDAILERKQAYRDLWHGKPLDKIPLDIRVQSPHRHTIRDRLMDADKQLEAAVADINLTIRHLAHTDAIPAMRPDVGCSCIASAFGSTYYWGDNPDQTPGIKEYLIEDLEEELGTLPTPETDSGWLGEGLRRVAMFAEAGGGVIPTALLDTAGGVNVAADLMGVSGLLEAMYTCPECVHELLERIQCFYLAHLGASIAAAGGEEHICTTDFVDLWFPEGSKGHISDDICAMYSPDFYDAFSAPYHAMVFRQYGYGGLHNCGPNPCAERYVASAHSPRCIDLAYSYSKDDLEKLAEALHKKAFLYLYWDGETEPVEWYRSVVERVNGKIIVVPSVTLKESDDIAGIYQGLSKISRACARDMDWGFLP